MSEIIPNQLFLGDVFDTTNEKHLSTNHIQCIVCLAKVNITTNRTLYKYELEDNYDCPIIDYFDEISNIIHHEISNGPVLVNCIAGISRSSSIVIAYLMKYHQMDLKNAFSMVKQKRNQICPNKKFMEYLITYEYQLYQKNSLTSNECMQLFYYS